jgi:hypothetical protein
MAIFLNWSPELNVLASVFAIGTSCLAEQAYAGLRAQSQQGVAVFPRVMKHPLWLVPKAGEA